MNNGKFFAGLALGALVGSALSCFAHSNRGRKLRRDVYDAIQDLQEDAKDLAHHAKHKAEEVSSEVAGKVGEKVEEVKETDRKSGIMSLYESESVELKEVYTPSCLKSKRKSLVMMLKKHLGWELHMR